MLDNPRIRVFAAFARENGVEALLDCLEKNKEAGVKYHYPGTLVGDYDRPKTEIGIVRLILYGKQEW